VVRVCFASVEVLVVFVGVCLLFKGRVAECSHILNMACPRCKGEMLPVGDKDVVYCFESDTMKRKMVCSKCVYVWTRTMKREVPITHIVRLASSGDTSPKIK